MNIRRKLTVGRNFALRTHCIKRFRKDHIAWQISSGEFAGQFCVPENDEIPVLNIPYSFSRLSDVFIERILPEDTTLRFVRKEINRSIQQFHNIFLLDDGTEIAIETNIIDQVLKTV
jgi:hypothetical protein